MRIRKILSITGSRADFSRLISTWRAVQSHPSLELVVVSTGSHLSPRYGYTLHEVEKEFSVRHKVDILMDSTSIAAIPKSLGLGLLLMSDIVSREDPDIILIIGDRSEMLIPAIIGIHLNIPVAHIGGGYVSSGVVDEQVRHAITKMAHIHFTPSAECTQRVLRMGEEPFRVFQVGSAAVDYLKSISYLAKGVLFPQLGLKTDCTTVVVSYHPVTTEVEDMRRNTQELLGALEELRCQVVVTYPNVDLGSHIILEELERINNPNFKIVENVPPHTYFNLLLHADLLVGNSSCAFVEAPYLALPAINVGNRQTNRARNVAIMDVPDNREAIIQAARAILADPDRRKQIREKFDNAYGNGTAGVKIADILATIPIDRRLLQKRMTY